MDLSMTMQMFPDGPPTVGAPAEVLVHQGALVNTGQGNWSASARSLGIRFTPASNMTIKRAELNIMRGATARTSDIRAEIWMDQGDGNAPYSVHSASDLQTFNSLPTVMTAVSFTGLNWAAVAGTPIWLIVTASVALPNVTDFSWGGDATAGRYMYTNTLAIGSWTLINNTANRMFKLYGTLP